MSFSPSEAAVPLSPVMEAMASGESATLGAFWRQRVEQHFRDSYAGIPMTKFPEDLATYEHLLWQRRPQIVLELGVFHGGSTLWFRDRLVGLARYGEPADGRVIAVDLDLAAARANVGALGPRAEEGIEWLEGDINDPEFIRVIEGHVPEGAEVLVVEDAAHDASCTDAALRGLSHLVRPGGFYVVEDTCVDVERLRGAEDWPRGCGAALSTWLQDTTEGARFRRRPDLQPYEVTCHPGGVLERVS